MTFIGRTTGSPPVWVEPVFWSCMWVQSEFRDKTLLGRWTKHCFLTLSFVHCLVFKYFLMIPSDTVLYMCVFVSLALWLLSHTLSRCVSILIVLSNVIVTSPAVWMYWHYVLCCTGCLYSTRVSYYFFNLIIAFVCVCTSPVCHKPSSL